MNEHRAYCVMFTYYTFLPT